MKRIIVGMSGGVDSSVAAMLLKKAGYEVVGITFKFIDDFDSTDATVVANKLGIEHHVLDYQEIFKTRIIDKFIEDYKNNLTPNPCIHCNREIKEKLLFALAKEYNCDYIATGHYAKIIDGRLYKSADLNKDQTYFLSLIPKDTLRNIILPLEGIEKSEVRALAKSMNLEVANKKDSTDVCFINDKFKDYMTSHVNTDEGDIIDIETGNVMGKHYGLSLYTLGQRRGLNIGGTVDRAYVVGKDVEHNILYVSVGDDNKYLLSDSCLVDEFNYLRDEKINKCKAKFRYRQEEVDVEVEWINDNQIVVKYPQGEKSVTPGQACVLYLGDECLGGGIIKEIRKDNNRLWYV